jgi:hypothetical protein
VGRRRAEQAAELGDEEWVAVGSLPDGADGRGRERPVTRGCEEVAYFTFVEATEREMHGPADAGEFPQASKQRLVTTDPCLSMGNHDQHACIPKLASHMLEKTQAGWIRPVQIVEHDDQRRRCRCRPEQARHGGEDTEALLRRSERYHSEARRVADEPRNLGGDARDGDQVTHRHVGAFRRRWFEPLQHLAPDPEWRRSVSFLGTSP